MTKNSVEYDRFEKLAQELIKVPHSEIKAKLDAEKKNKVQRKRTKKPKA